MSYTVSELLLRNLRDVFGENDPARRRAAINELYNEECVFYDPNKGAHRGRDAIDRIAGIIRPPTQTISISRSARLRSWAMLRGAGGCQAPLARRQLTPEPISSLRGTAGSPPSISSSMALAMSHGPMTIQSNCKS
ncbi:MAG: hypothetical protein WAL14_10540 [Pseudolabrys sp.]